MTRSAQLSIDPRGRATGVAMCLAVLVVEDNADIRELVVDILESEGFQVYQADNGLRALDVLKDMPQPSLVLADLMMPVLDGWRFLRALREDDRFATLPVVVVSAWSASAPRGYRRMKKPIDVSDLVRIVSELCLRRM